MHVDDVVITHPGAVPHLVDDLPTRERQLRAGGQGDQDVELGRCQGDGFAGQVDLRGRVDAQVAEHPGGLLGVDAGHAGAGPTQHGLHPGNQLTDAERLGDIVVGADGEADEPVHLVGAGGDDDDVAVAEGADLAAHLHPVHAGQAQVQ